MDRFEDENPYSPPNLITEDVPTPRKIPITRERIGPPAWLYFSTMAFGVPLFFLSIILVIAYLFFESVHYLMALDGALFIISYIGMLTFRGRWPFCMAAIVTFFWVLTPCFFIVFANV